MSFFSKNHARLLFYSIRYLVGMVFLCSNVSLVSATNIEFLEDVPVTTQVQMLLDTVDKYLYEDIKIAQKAMQQCEEIIAGADELSDQALLNYAIQKIYLEHSNSTPLEAYKLIRYYDHLTQVKDITPKSVNTFDYLEAFTLMSLGDREAALESYYEGLRKGRAQQDTNLLIRNLHALSQLHNDDGQHEQAKKYLLEVKQLQQVYPIRLSTRMLIDYELSESYLQTEQYDQALDVLNRSLRILEKEKAGSLKPDFLLFKAEIALAQEDFEETKRIYEEALLEAKNNGDQRNLLHCQIFESKFLEKKGDYQKALEVQKSLLEIYDSTEYVVILEGYQNLQRIYHLLGNDAEAYRYLSLYNDLQKRLNVEEQEKNKDFLQVKFDTEQQLAENRFLTLQVEEKKSQNKLLYIIILLFVLGVLGLFGMVYQKQKYNSRLKKEVDNRTEELATANHKLIDRNKELNEFNRILSHDLKEPLRSIVGFSQLAKSQVGENPKLEEYLQIIEKSGRQLHTIISDISFFQGIKEKVAKPDEKVDVELLVKNIEKVLRKENISQSFQLSFNTLPTISTKKKVVEAVFENLIQNGLKYNQSEVPSVILSYENEFDFHVFDFIDNGIGISKEYHETIFELFKRLHNREEYEGSGLGLSIVKKILEKMGGSIEILDSEERKGSTFQVKIPKN